MAFYYRYKNIITITCFLASGFIFSSDYYDQFLRANTLYEQERFEDALSEYLSITDKGVSTYYNIGLCYFYLQKYPEAITYWHKAAKGASYRTRKELYSLQTRVPGYKDARAWYAIAFDEVQWMLSWLSLLFLQLLFLISWCIACVALFYPIKKSYIASNIIFCTILTLFLWIKWDDERPSAIVLKEASLFAGPNDSYQVVASVRPLKKVYVSHINSGWCKVASEKENGWVPFDYLQVI